MTRRRLGAYFAAIPTEKADNCHESSFRWVGSDSGCLGPALLPTRLPLHTQLGIGFGHSLVIAATRLRQIPPSFCLSDWGIFLAGLLPLCQPLLTAQLIFCTRKSESLFEYFLRLCEWSADLGELLVWRNSFVCLFDLKKQNVVSLLCQYELAGV